MYEARVESLRTKHATLDAMILQEQARPAPDSTRLRKLKLDKLQVKDEIVTLTAQLYEH